jgi:drug/metabolite transporter (DMT)-like permease
MLLLLLDYFGSQCPFGAYFWPKSLFFAKCALTYLSGRQMLNGAIVVFGAIFSVVILKRKMTPLRWVAIGFATIGLALVGTSGILNESSEGVSGKFIIGIALVLGGQVVGSLHMISEEKLMSYTDPFDPDHLAGIVRRFLSLQNAISTTYLCLSFLCHLAARAQWNCFDGLFIADYVLHTSWR